MKVSLISVLAVVGAMICAAAYAGLTDGLVGYWSFDDGTAKDNSGMGNHGQISYGGPKVVDGQVGKALDFDGDDGIDVPDDPSLRLADALTVAAWVYPRSVLDPTIGEDHCGICWKGQLIGWGADVYNWRIATCDPQGLTWGSCGGGTEGYFATANCFSEGLEKWYHVALVEDGTEGTAYINGEALTDDDVTGGDRHRPSAPYDVWEGEPVRIGYAQGRGGDINTLTFFDGIIDEVVVYNRALSADEIKQLMTTRPAAVNPSAKLTTTWGAIKR